MAHITYSQNTMTGLEYAPDRKEFYGDFTDLLGTLNKAPYTIEVYFEKTAVTKIFTKYRTEFNADGDIECWVYDGPGGFTLKIFND